MEPQDRSPEPTLEPFDIFLQVLGRALMPEEEHIPEFYVTVEDLNQYLEWIKQYDFIQVKIPREHRMGGDRAAIRFPDGRTIYLWQDSHWI
jgi:hypothetical protein